MVPPPPENETLHQPHIKILADGALLLTLLDDLRNNVLVHLGHLPDLVLARRLLWWVSIW